MARQHARVDALHALLLKAGLYQRFDEQWALYAAISGGIASDLSGELSSDDNRPQSDQLSSDDHAATATRYSCGDRSRRLRRA